METDKRDDKYKTDCCNFSPANCDGPTYCWATQTIYLKECPSYCLFYISREELENAISKAIGLKE